MAGRKKSRRATGSGPESVEPRQPAFRALAGIADHPAAAMLVTAGLVIGLWLSPTYLYEDGMFYLRYAQNLALGHGLVYNPGEYYEGNTAFLWTILLTPAFWLGVEPGFYLRALGGLFAVGVLGLTYWIVAATESRRAGLLAVVLLGTHYSFMIMAVSGFAPHLQSFFALLTLLLILRLWEKPGVAAAVGVGCCLSALLLTRLDSVLFAAVLGVVALFAAWRSESRRLTIALVGGLPAFTFACFLAWKLYYYGDILPTTYYIKAGPQVPEAFDLFGRGVTYIWLYLREYWFVYLLPVFLYGAYCRLKSTPRISGAERRERRGRATKRKGRQHMPALSSRHIVMLACAAMTILWLLYMPRIGGDYSEFRMLVPVAPFIFILIVGALRGLRGAWRPVAMATAALLICASFYHQFAYRESIRPGVAVPSASRFLTSIPASPEARKEHWLPSNNWKRLGEVLRTLLAESEDYPAHLKISTTAGGYLPFYSRLHNLERHGFTDPRILLPGNHTISLHNFPGHHITATPNFLLEMGINLAFGHPLIINASHNYWPDIKEVLVHLTGVLNPEYYSLPEDMQIVEIPIGGGKKIIGLYLTRNAKLDAILREHNIVVHDVPPPAG